MLREQMINFLEAAVVFLLATNAASVLAALYAMRLANAGSLAPQAKGVITRRFDAMLRALACDECNESKSSRLHNLSKRP
jgi:hypothetical protein